MSDRLNLQPVKEALPASMPPLVNDRDPRWNPQDGDLLSVPGVDWHHRQYYVAIRVKIRTPGFVGWHYRDNHLQETSYMKLDDWQKWTRDAKTLEKGGVA